MDVQPCIKTSCNLFILSRRTNNFYNFGNRSQYYLFSVQPKCYSCLVSYTDAFIIISCHSIIHKSLFYESNYIMCSGPWRALLGNQNIHEESLECLAVKCSNKPLPSPLWYLLSGSWRHRI